jgi:hypothetical protein
MPVSPKYLIAKTVAMDDAPMFTRLLPTRIVPSSLLGFSLIWFITLAPLTFSSNIWISRILLSDINAVSDAEKKADKQSRRPSNAKSAVVLRSKIDSSLLAGKHQKSSMISHKANYYIVIYHINFSLYEWLIPINLGPSKKN